jgi:hypothetical protein
LREVTFLAAAFFTTAFFFGAAFFFTAAVFFAVAALLLTPFFFEAAFFLARAMRAVTREAAVMQNAATPSTSPSVPVTWIVSPSRIGGCWLPKNEPAAPNGSDDPHLARRVPSPKLGSPLLNDTFPVLVTQSPRMWIKTKLV